MTATIPKLGQKQRYTHLSQGNFHDDYSDFFFFLLQLIPYLRLFSEKLNLNPRTPLRGNNRNINKETQTLKRNLDTL